MKGICPWKCTKSLEHWWLSIEVSSSLLLRISTPSCNLKITTITSSVGWQSRPRGPCGENNVVDTTPGPIEPWSVTTRERLGTTRTLLAFLADIYSSTGSVV